jgi:hypothetical protein
LYVAEKRKKVAGFRGVGGKGKETWKKGGGQRVPY